MANIEKTSSLEMVYPVGSIYMSVNDISPASLFGGTWERIEDRFLLAAGETYKAGRIGGEAQHELTQEEIPDYKIGDIPEVVPQTHGNWNNGGIKASTMGDTSPSKPGVANNNNILQIKSGEQWSFSVHTDGGSQPHNNMPPYLGVYMWKRIA